MNWFERIVRFFTGKREERPAGPEERGTADEFPEAYVVTDFLDLHGFFPEQVMEMVDEFLENARRLGIEEVRIAHGKGKSVMRREVWKLLEGHPLVTDFRQAPPDRGSWGATIVRIRPLTLPKTPSP